jgi:hypothetical protein
MKSERNVSSLSEHKLYRKKGVVVAPLNDGLGERLTSSSWSRERMPEYLWLGLILMDYGREDGLERAGKILLDTSKKVKSLLAPSLSKIFSLSQDDQRIIFQIISEKVEPVVLSPLTILYRESQFPEFNHFFYVQKISFEERLERINDAIKVFSPHQSNEATDLRFLSLALDMFGGRIHVASHLKDTAEALSHYPYTSHEDERMRWYRPTVRAMEGAFGRRNGTEFSTEFWNDIGRITRCTPMSIVHKNNEIDYQAFINRFQQILTYILASHKSESLADDKFDVILGSTAYALKLFNEINDNGLGNNVLGRHGARTIIEVLIILKYLLKREAATPTIWEEYKLYGIGKYKLVLLKAREVHLADTSHFSPSVADMLVNEIKWEEFVDVDLKYFDSQGIREKSIEVGEKQLFDLFYDYDSSFSHALWGAVRESSMLKCDNASHQYHVIPDINLSQTLPDVKPDCYDVMMKLLLLLRQTYSFPEELMPSD